jgi:hypothetical protein
MDAEERFRTLGGDFGPVHAGHIVFLSRGHGSPFAGETVVACAG